ncbi:MAG: stage III sporulation protein AF [Kyrpidia sp.]|nr:stage III sporulation protein AF [Kyrpidia sp.]
MDALVAWLRQVVLVLLAAAFLDWMLPTNTMQRYVKVVMGLVVVGTLLTPLMQIFHLTESWKAAVASLAMPEGPDPAGAGLTLRVMQWEAQRAQDAWVEEVRRRVAERAEAVSGRSVLSVQVEAGPAAPDPVPAPPELRRVTVVLGATPASRARGSPADAAGGPAILPVRPVHIGSDVAQTSSVDSSLQRTVAQTVASDLGVDPSRVDVRTDAAQMGGGPE